MSALATFRMPMFRAWVPQVIRPWIYVLTACCFQFSGCVYLGALEAIRGTTNFMIEDLVFLLFSGLAGMAVWFVMLFRMKFRFTNQQLLCVSACVIAVCNFIIMSTTNMIILVPICFLSGCAKIQGTFECMSNIQLWITPTRDFGVFFPVLHVVLLTAIIGGGWLAAVVAYHFSWQMMHLFTVGTMSFVVLSQLLLCQPFCPMPQRIPVRHVGWIGAVLICVNMLMVSYMLIYGDYLEWFHSPRMRVVAGLALVVSAMALWHLSHAEKPYINLGVFRYTNVVPILIVMCLAEVMLGAEHTLEEILYAEVVSLEEHTKEAHFLWALPGAYVGVGVTLFWLGHKRWKVWKLFAVAFALTCGYALWMYMHLDPNAPYTDYRPACMMRGCAYAILAASLMWSLHESIPDLEHFFMGLFVFNIIHMYLAGAMAYGVYTHLFSIQLADTIAQYSGYLTVERVQSLDADVGAVLAGEEWLHSMMSVTLKQVYGLLIWLAGLMTVIFLLLDLRRVRTGIRKVPYWPVYGIEYLARLFTR